MKTNDTLGILLLFFTQITFGQLAASSEIQGQILEQSTLVEGVNIINNATQVSAVSDINGRFSVIVKEGNVLVFSSVNLNPVKHRITVEDLKSNSLQIKMTVREMELKEVVVNENSHITAENLGIIPRGQKKYTPAERRLAAGAELIGLQHQVMRGVPTPWRSRVRATVRSRSSSKVRLTLRTRSFIWFWTASWR